MGSESAGKDMDETTTRENACQNDEMRFSLPVLAYRLPSMNVEVHVSRGEGKSKKPASSCGNRLRPC
jgi:hypothetical protein